MSASYEELEKRLHNVECMLMAYVAATKELLSPDVQRLLSARQDEWYGASKLMGAFRVASVQYPNQQGPLQ